jgi:hypothetical protein
MPRGEELGSGEGELVFKTRYVFQQQACLLVFFSEPLQTTVIKLAEELQSHIFGGCDLILHTR